MTATSPGMQGGKREREKYGPKGLSHSYVEEKGENAAFFLLFLHIRESGRRRLGFFCVAIRVCCSYKGSKCSGWPLKERRPRVCVVGGGGGPPYSSAEGKKEGDESFIHPQIRTEMGNICASKKWGGEKIVLHMYTPVTSLCRRECTSTTESSNPSLSLPVCAIVGNGGGVCTQEGWRRVWRLRLHRE